MMYLVKKLKFKRRGRREHIEFIDLIDFSANSATLVSKKT